jgi:hypothetical protein
VGRRGGVRRIQSFSSSVVAEREEIYTVSISSSPAASFIVLHC